MRSVWTGFVWLCAIGLILLTPAAAWAEKRIALIVGNSDYDLVSSLDNPGNDASDISVALESLGFEVFLGLDLGRAEMDRIVAKFTEATATADVSMFYYAGHGFQVNGQNYLVPTDARIQEPSDVVEATVPLEQILNAMEQGPGIKFVFLDACRDNPFEGIADVPVGEGLARVGDAADFLISFATQPGNVALDGHGNNSPFAEAMLKHIETPGFPTIKFYFSRTIMPPSKTASIRYPSC